jgi:nucleoside-diphosphate-sugar epimerase
MVPTVLVTGATGMAGRYVVPALQARGFRVRGQFNTRSGDDSNVDWRQIDFRNSSDFALLVDGCHAVVHLAAELSDTSRMQRVNVEAACELLAAAKSAGVRYFGYASSVVVYGSPRQRLVDEATPVIDPNEPISTQYYAEPYMLEYARSKVAAELALRELEPDFPVDFYRPAVVADTARLLEAGTWSLARKVGAAYRRTQYIYAPDAAAAVAYLTDLGLSRSTRSTTIESFNICDENCGTFRDVLRMAFEATGRQHYKLRTDLPYLLDWTNNLAKYRSAFVRYPLGMLYVSNAKLRGTGFKLPIGIKAAIEAALAALPRNCIGQLERDR